MVTLAARLKEMKGDEAIEISDVPPDQVAKLKMNLTLSGFIKIAVRDNVVTGSKPNYNLGSAMTISDQNTIDASTLLTKKDLEKPDDASLAAPCGANKKKRRACANCTCGLAEEIAGNDALSTEQRANPKSACGSCYLGDAFRCASCPYLGMPAFKPGEKPSVVALDDGIDDI